MQWKISSKLDKYYYPHYIKVRVMQGTKVTRQRMSAFEITILSFLGPANAVRQRLSEAKHPPFKSFQTCQMLTAQPLLLLLSFFSIQLTSPN